jgi:hypothetical protein
MASKRQAHGAKTGYALEQALEEPICGEKTGYIWNRPWLFWGRARDEKTDFTLEQALENPVITQRNGTSPCLSRPVPGWNGRAYSTLRKIQKTVREYLLFLPRIKLKGVYKGRSHLFPSPNFSLASPFFSLFFFFFFSFLSFPFSSPEAFIKLRQCLEAFPDQSKKRTKGCLLVRLSL